MKDMLQFFTQYLNYQIIAVNGWNAQTLSAICKLPCTMSSHVTGVNTDRRLFNGSIYINVLFVRGCSAAYPIPSFMMTHLMNILIPMDIYILYPAFTQCGVSLLHVNAFQHLMYCAKYGPPALDKNAAKIINKYGDHGFSFSKLASALLPGHDDTCVHKDCRLYRTINNDNAFTCGFHTITMTTLSLLC